MRWFTSRIRRFWRRVRRTPKKITIPIAIVILIALSFGIYHGAQFYTYMQDDPDFCRSCHIMESAWDRWSTSEHRDVNCHSCHKQSQFASAMLVVDFIFGDFERVESHAVVSDEACEECHWSGNAEWLQVAATAGHRVHAEEQNIACVKCHAVTVHRFEPPGPICNVCHEDKHIEITGMASMHCTSCHPYLAEQEQLLPQRKDCLACHQAMTELGVTWPTDAPMQYPCGDCHQPHLQAEPIVVCLSCHSVEGLHLAVAHGASSCQTCHKPHEWQITQRETCLTCHPGRAEHNADFLCSSCHGFVEGEEIG